MHRLELVMGVGGDVSGILTQSELVRRKNGKISNFSWYLRREEPRLVGRDLFPGAVLLKTGFDGIEVWAVGQVRPTSPRCWRRHECTGSNSGELLLLEDGLAQGLKWERTQRPTGFTRKLPYDRRWRLSGHCWPASPAPEGHDHLDPAPAGWQGGRVGVGRPPSPHEGVASSGSKKRSQAVAVPISPSDGHRPESERFVAHMEEDFGPTLYEEPYDPRFGRWYCFDEGFPRFIVGPDAAISCRPSPEFQLMAGLRVRSKGVRLNPSSKLCLRKPQAGWRQFQLDNSTPGAPWRTLPADCRWLVDEAHPDGRGGTPSLFLDQTLNTHRIGESCTRQFQWQRRPGGAKRLEFHLDSRPTGSWLPYGGTIARAIALALVLSRCPGARDSGFPDEEALRAGGARLP